MAFFMRQKNKSFCSAEGFAHSNPKPIKKILLISAIIGLSFSPLQPL
jgi:hypothetical protein